MYIPIWFLGDKASKEGESNNREPVGFLVALRASINKMQFQNGTIWMLSFMELDGWELEGK